MALPPPLPKPKKVRSGSALSGCFIAFLVAFGALFLIALATAIVVPNFVRARQKQLKELELPVQIAIKPYDTLIGEGLSGSGFHFEWKGKRYIGCSLHQFDNETPGEMLMADLDENVKITKQLFKGEDFQILSYESPKLDEIKPLDYRPGVELAPGHPVILHLLDGYVIGHITRVKSSLDGLTHFRLEKPFEAAGCSGSPVVSGITGTVIGIALTANSPDSATDVGFELMNLPELP